MYQEKKGMGGMNREQGFCNWERNLGNLEKGKVPGRKKGRNGGGRTDD